MPKCCRYTIAMLVPLVLASCSIGVPRPTDNASINEVYDAVHRSGARETAQLLNQGMRSRGLFGATDPYYPLRTPDEVVPVWKRPRPDSETGRRADPHWEYTVIRRSGWWYPK